MKIVTVLLECKVEGDRTDAEGLFQRWLHLIYPELIWQREARCGYSEDPCCKIMIDRMRLAIQHCQERHASFSTSGNSESFCFQSLMY